MNVKVYKLFIITICKEGVIVGHHSLLKPGSILYREHLIISRKKEIRLFALKTLRQFWAIKSSKLTPYWFICDVDETPTTNQEV